MTVALSDDDKLAIATRFAATLRTNDAEGYRAMCAPGSVTWHNFDDVEVTAEHTVRTVQWLHRTVADLGWTDIALLPTPSGFVSQTIMTGTAPGGRLNVFSCVVATLNDDGLITRIEEYLDPAQSAALRG